MMLEMKLISDEKLVTSDKFNKRELTQLSHSELVSESIPRRKLAVFAGKILKPSWIMRLCPKAWFWASYGFRFAHPTANPLQDDSYDNTHNSLVTSCSLLVTRKQAKLAFTMAEILLSLTIIGVVAAITLPSLTGNINERTWNTQRKALYARMSQAIALMPALNGYGQIAVDDDGNTTTDTVAETFITSGLAKVLKINNICSPENIADCGITATYTNMAGSKTTMPTTVYGLNDKFNFSFTETDGTPREYSQKDTKAAAFETANGESILAFYNPTCQSDLLKDFRLDFAQAKMCVNFIYDLNGKKGPNTIGKDIGAITVLYPSDSFVVMPVPTNRQSNNFKYELAVKFCREQDNESRLPNIEEAMSLFYNNQLFNITCGSDDCWTSSVTDSKKAKAIHLGTGRIYNLNKETYNLNAICVKRN